MTRPASSAPEPITAQVEQLRRRWAQAHIEHGPHGHVLVHLPGMRLPAGWNKTICTASFVALVVGGMLHSPLDGFFVDMHDLRLADGRQPDYSRGYALNEDTERSLGMTLMYGGAREDVPGFPQWRDLTRFWWRAQAFNPNRDTLYTSAMLVKQRLSMVQ